MKLDELQEILAEERRIARAELLLEIVTYVTDSEYQVTGQMLLDRFGEKK